MYSRQASVWIVKPGGTGRPAFVISASPAPLPPRTSFIFPLPSALPPPKKYTYFVVAGFVAVILVSAGFVSMMPVSGRVVVAMYILYCSNSQWGRFAYAARKFIANPNPQFLLFPPSPH